MTVAIKLYVCVTDNQFQWVRVDNCVSRHSYNSDFARLFSLSASINWTLLESQSVGILVVFTIHAAAVTTSFCAADGCIFVRPSPTWTWHLHIVFQKH